MNRQQGDIFLQYLKGELSREEATDKILHHALKSRKWLFKHDYDDDDDDGQEAEGEKESEDEEFFDTSNVLSPEDRERDLIRKNIQTDKVLDLIGNTTPTVAQQAQQAQPPTVDQQADMYNLEPLQKENQHRNLHLLLITNKRIKRRTRVGVKKEEDTKLTKQKVKKKRK